MTIHALGLFLVFLLLPLPKGICQTTSNHINQAKAHSHAPDDSASSELLHKGLSPPARQEQVQARPRGLYTSTICLETLNIRVAGEEKDGREEHWEELEGPGMLREDQRSEHRWRE